MATLYITEHVGIREQGGVVQAAQRPGLRQQTVAIGGSSTQCALAFKDDTRLLRVHTDAICSISIGTNPTATVTDSRMAANTTEYFSVRAGDKIAVIANS